VRLLDLHPTFLQATGLKAWRNDVPRAEANGIRFLCPKCFAANGGAEGTHSVICWSPGAPVDIRPAPGRWRLEGSGFGDLSLVAGSSSVQLLGGCDAHFYVDGGLIRMC
jgi:hypothetical protein